MRRYGRGRPAVSTKKFAIVCVGVWSFSWNDPAAVDSWADAILEAMREEQR